MHLSAGEKRYPMNAPERDLLVALFRRALFDYFGASEEQRRSAEEWFFSDDLEEQGVFTFSWTCMQLGVDAGSVRTRLLTMERDESLSTQEWWGKLAVQA